MEIKIKKLNENAIIPTKAHAGDAGSDLYACLDEDVMILPGAAKPIGTGVAIAIPDGYFGAVFARSGLACREGVRPSNCVGVCDSGYRNEYIVYLRNDSHTPHVVRHGDRIAQLVVMPFLNIEFEEVDELDKTDRGLGGFGSSGK